MLFASGSEHRSSFFATISFLDVSFFIVTLLVSLEEALSEASLRAPGCFFFPLFPFGFSPGPLFLTSLEG